MPESIFIKLNIIHHAFFIENLRQEINSSEVGEVSFIVPASHTLVSDHHVDEIFIFTGGH
jgi:hypothetical protein